MDGPPVRYWVLLFLLDQGITVRIRDGLDKDVAFVSEGNLHTEGHGGRTFFVIELPGFDTDGFSAVTDGGTGNGIHEPRLASAIDKRMMVSGVLQLA